LHGAAFCGNPNLVINDCVVQGRDEAVNPNRMGTKAAARSELAVPAGGAATIRLRLSDRAPESGAAPFGD
jgi:hypothetical protein